MTFPGKAVGSQYTTSAAGRVVDWRWNPNRSSHVAKPRPRDGSGPGEWVSKPLIASVSISSTRRGFGFWKQSLGLSGGIEAAWHGLRRGKTTRTRVVGRALEGPGNDRVPSGTASKRTYSRHSGGAFRSLGDCPSSPALTGPWPTRLPSRARRQRQKTGDFN